MVSGITLSMYRKRANVQEEGYYDYRMKPMRSGFFMNAKPQRPEDLIEYDFDKSPTMQIPGDWNTQDERLFFYEGTVWFKKSFQAVPMSDYRTLLYFGAVNYDCRVWVNGKEAGHHIVVELWWHHARCEVG